MMLLPLVEACWCLSVEWVWSRWEQSLLVVAWWISIRSPQSISLFIPWSSPAPPVPAALAPPAASSPRRHTGLSSQPLRSHASLWPLSASAPHPSEGCSDPPAGRFSSSLPPGSYPRGTCRLLIARSLFDLRQSARGARSAHCEGSTPSNKPRLVRWNNQRDHEWASGSQTEGSLLLSLSGLAKTSAHFEPRTEQSTLSHRCPNLQAQDERWWSSQREVAWYRPTAFAAPH